MNVNDIIPTLDFHELQFFCTVSYMDSITQAAELLHVSQPYLSRVISSFEKKLGVELFERSGNRVRLNDFGRVFRKRAEAALAEISNGLNEINARNSEKAGHVSISTANYEITTMIEQFIIDNPCYTISHTVNSVSELKLSLTLGSLDFGIFSCDDPHEFTGRSIQLEPLIEDEILLLVPSSSELADKPEGIGLRELAGEPFVLTKGPFGYPAGIRAFLYDSDHSPRILLESYNTNTTRRMVAGGMAYSFITLVEWYELKTTRKSLVTDPSMIKNANKVARIKDPGCKRQLYLARHNHHFLSKAAEAFREFTLDYFSGIRSSMGTLFSEN